MPFGKYEDYTIAPSFNDGIAAVATLPRKDGLVVISKTCGVWFLQSFLLRAENTVARVAESR